MKDIVTTIPEDKLFTFLVKTYGKKECLDNDKNEKKTYMFRQLEPSGTHQYEGTDLHINEATPLYPVLARLLDGLGRCYVVFEKRPVINDDYPMKRHFDITQISNGTYMYVCKGTIKKLTSESLISTDHKIIDQLFCEIRDSLLPDKQN